MMDFRVNRGGSWYNSTGYCRSANRFNFDPGFRYNFIGLRIVVRRRDA